MQSSGSYRLRRFGKFRSARQNNTDARFSSLRLRFYVDYYIISSDQTALKYNSKTLKQQQFEHQKLRFAIAIHLVSCVAFMSCVVCFIFMLLICWAVRKDGLRGQLTTALSARHAPTSLSTAVCEWWFSIVINSFDIEYWLKFNSNLMNSNLIVLFVDIVNL